MRKIGNAVRISAQLIDGATDTQRWSQTWDRKLDDVFAIQDEIAAAVVGQLRVHAARRGADGEADRPAGVCVDPAGRSAARSGEPEEHGAVDRVEQAGSGDRAERGARLGRAGASVFQSDSAGCVDSGSSVLLDSFGRVDEAVALQKYRVAHDPANPVAYHNLGISLYLAGRWDAAIDAERTALRLSPDFTGAHASIGNNLLIGKADAESALKEYQAETDEANRLCGLPLALHSLGRVAQADAGVQGFLDRFGADQPGNMPPIYARSGQLDAAFEWLEKSAAAHDQLISSVAVEPLLDRLHDDPRWLPFLRKVGYAPEQVAKIEFKVKLPQAERGRTNGQADH